MARGISESAFERAIVETLTGSAEAPAVAEPSPAWGDILPGGYLSRSPDDYDRHLCLIPQDVLDFILATQPQEWNRLEEHHQESTKDRFLTRLSREIRRRGTLDVLRNGVKDSGCRFRLAFFRPSSGLNEELQRLYRANLFSVIRQLRYSEKSEKSLDLGLFLNGLPLFTAELKNPLTAQSVQDAIKQYSDPLQRDPREPLLSYGRCLAHFAVDPDAAYVATELRGQNTHFLPFNQGYNKGAGNPPVPPTREGYPTDYLWKRIWARDSVLDLVQRFIHEVHKEDEKGKKTGERILIFPRYHQLEAVRTLAADARREGPGKRYLIEHSAGSGKSFTIAWLAHRLSTLHDSEDRRVFDSIVVITDRRVLDRQLQDTVRQFEQTLGVVENIDQTSRQLKEALEAGKTIIVTTLQKFPVIVESIGELAGQRFAVIVDEAHSSQTGESSKSLKSVLAAESLEEAAAEEADAETPEEEIEARVLAEVQARGPQPNLSLFAFTATPKEKTLELFGRKRPDGGYEPFHLYSMRQAIEEGFILDVLENYTTYSAFWRLLKKIEDDPHYDKGKASSLLKSFVELHPHAIEEKVRVMVDHFASQVHERIGGKAKAMIVTASRLHAVRARLALDRVLAERGLPWKALVAFSDTVQDGGKAYTEANMNGVSDRQTAAVFERPGYRFLVVANKFQTGFDQPLLHTMYVDKKLGGVNAVQTLSRLNRTHPDKQETSVLDFVNEADAIRKAFEPYYETTLLSEGTDPNLLYDVQQRVEAYGVFTEGDVEEFAAFYFSGRGWSHDQIHNKLAVYIELWKELAEEEMQEFRSDLREYVRLYRFLAQILPFSDLDLEKLYAFARHLRPLLQVQEPGLPLEVQRAVDMESYRLQKTHEGGIELERRAGRLQPRETKGAGGLAEEEMEPLSRIIAELNERFGIDIGPEGRFAAEQMMEDLDQDRGLAASARANTRENVRLAFEHKANESLQKIIDTSFDFYKLITDDKLVGEQFKDRLFDEYIRKYRQAENLIQQQESKTLEFKSSLRWNLKDDRKDDRQITHAVLKTIAAFLNTDGGDLLIGVDDDGTPLGINHDQLDDDDRFLRHLSQVVINGLGERAATCIDPRTQVVQGKTVCLVSCERSPEPVRLKWKGTEESPEGDFYVRIGPRTDRLDDESTEQYTATRWAGGSENREEE